MNEKRGGGGWRWVVVAALCAWGPAQAQSLDLTLPRSMVSLGDAPQPPPPTATAHPEPGSVADYFAHWFDRVRAVRASQPSWSSPVVTTTALLEQRLRFDASFQHAGNGADTTILDGGKGLDLIVGNTQEIQIASIPYDIRSSNQSGRGKLSGFGDWPFLRFKQRLASSPESEGDYIVSAWLQIQAPTGISALSNHAWTLLPTLGFGKGWGPFVIQGTIGAAIPTAYEARIGSQITNNLAFQYRLRRIFWPQLEVNWTYFPDGQRGGKNQVLLTPGLVAGRLPLTDQLRLTVGVGYQSAITPNYHASPLVPAYNHAWILSSRLGF